MLLETPPLSKKLQKPPSQGLTAAAIQDSLLQRFSAIDDYTALVTISVSMPRFRIPEKQLRLYYKRPGRVKIEAEGFAVVPRTGLAPSPVEIIGDLFRLRVAGTMKNGDRTTWILEGQIHPDSARFGLFDRDIVEGGKLKMRLWIDGQGWFISRVETLLDTVAVMVVESTFREYEKRIWLPEQTELAFFISARTLEKMGDREPMGGPLGETHGEPGLEDFEGRVRLKYSGYRINTGLDDRIFRESDF